MESINDNIGSIEIPEKNTTTEAPIPEGQVQSESKKSPFITGFEVLQTDFPESKYLVDNLIPAGTISLLCGPSDTGKSIFARQIAVAAALGKDKVAGFKLNLVYNAALYVSTEDAARDWNDKLQRYNLSNEEKKKLKNLHLGFDSESFSAKSIDKALTTHPVDIVVIDVFTDIFSNDLNSSIQVRAFFNTYEEVARKHGCSILFIHHVSKKGESSNPSKSNVLGSMAIEAKVRSVLEIRMNSDDNYRDLYITKSNYLSPVEKKLPFKLKLDSNTLEFEFTGDRPERVKSMLGQMTNNPATIAKVLSLKDDGLSYRQIADKLSEEGNTISKTTVGDIVKLSKAQDNKE